ncbi:urate oxidase [Streptomyces sp. DvalAA-14]|uniref:factor-independent urate hydroxylase n=1 Tax=unclassified Streptomyces TaxID=2593676 RepID=UPI00081B027F|nr:MULTISPECIES: urate oxidase [unclassified Streptomyces]MYS24765.1 urate oxidase [Streptomyces sp. SID4948]SCE49143.1 urate oxidase [Streptomyces sp. DvalAA-14]
MTAESRPARVTRLGPNQYGKAETRVVRIVRDGATHHIKDLSVSVALSGAMEDVHRSGSNAAVLPTDTAKNTVFAFAKEHGIASAEDFGIRLARHFVTSRPSIHRARVRIEEYGWERITAPPGASGEHSFVRTGQETRTAEVVFDGEDLQVVSGLKDLVVMNSTDSEFWGFVRDAYTTLEETRDRILATEVTARWRFRWTGGEQPAQPAPAWDESYRQARRHLLAAFADTYSLSLQQTLFAMGSRVVEQCAELDEVRLSLPNKHHFPVDLTPFGLANDNEVFFAADRPYGLIEGTVLREGAQARIPVTD